MGVYEVRDGLPINPMGRTGLMGRGQLGRWGPNHAGDPIVTRYTLPFSVIAYAELAKLTFLQ